MALPRQNYQKFLMWERCSGKLNYLKSIAINYCTIQSLLLNIKERMKIESNNFWLIVLCVSVLYLFAKLLYICHLGTHCILLQRLKCPLNLSSELKKSNTKVFRSKNFGLLGIKFIYDWPDSPSWYISTRRIGSAMNKYTVGVYTPTPDLT